MAQSANDLKIIHTRKLATPGKKYYGDDENVYIGTKDGRLRILDKSSVTYFKPTEQLSSNNVQGAIEEVVNNSTENAQDAIGDILTNTSDIEFTYNDSVPEITAELTTTGVASGTYGDASNSAQFFVDSKGRISSVTNIAITGSGTSASFANSLMLGGM